MVSPKKVPIGKIKIKNIEEIKIILLRFFAWRFLLLVVFNLLNFFDHMELNVKSEPDIKLIAPIIIKKINNS